MNAKEALKNLTEEEAKEWAHRMARLQAKWAIETIKMADEYGIDRDFAMEKVAQGFMVLTTLGTFVEFAGEEEE